jgi:hypothetical protein
VIHLLGEDIAIAARIAVFPARSWNQFPAGNRKIKDCGALLTRFISAAADAPAGGDGQEFLDPGNIETLVGQKLAEALEPLQVVVGVKSFPAASSRPDETFLFVDAKGSWMDTEEFSNDSDGIESFFVFEFHARILLYQLGTKSSTARLIVRDGIKIVNFFPFAHRHTRENRDRIFSFPLANDIEDTVTFSWFVPATIR